MTLLDPAPPGAPATASPAPLRPDTDAAGYTIAEVAQRVGVTAHTLRYYERIGLLAVERDAGGRRVYRDEDVARVVFITRLRSTNLPIRELQRYFELADAGPHTEADRLALLERHRDNVRRQLADIHDALAAIDFKIEMYGGSLAACSA